MTHAGIRGQMAHSMKLGLKRLTFAAVLGALAITACSIGGSGPKTEVPAKKSAPSIRSGCEASLPASQATSPTLANLAAPGSLLVDPSPILWGLNLPPGVPLSLDSSVDLPPWHVSVAHEFNPQLNVKDDVEARVYLIFPRNDFTVKVPKAGWYPGAGSAANVVYCGDVHGVPNLSRGATNDVFWLTPLVARPFSIQWQVAGAAKSGALSTALRGFTITVTPCVTPSGAPRAALESGRLSSPDPTRAWRPWPPRPRSHLRPSSALCSRA
jgi:hypothetical protein